MSFYCHLQCRSILWDYEMQKELALPKIYTFSQKSPNRIDKINLLRNEEVLHSSRYVGKAAWPLTL